MSRAMPMARPVINSVIKRSIHIYTPTVTRVAEFEDAKTIKEDRSQLVQFAKSLPENKGARRVDERWGLVHKIEQHFSWDPKTRSLSVDDPREDGVDLVKQLSWLKLNIPKTLDILKPYNNKCLITIKCSQGTFVPPHRDSCYDTAVIALGAYRDSGEPVGTKLTKSASLMASLDGGFLELPQNPALGHALFMQGFKVYHGTNLADDDPADHVKHNDLSVRRCQLMIHVLNHGQMIS